MISGITAFNGNRYTQSFGNNYGYKKIKNNPYSNCIDKFLKSPTTDKAKGTSEKPQFSKCAADIINKVTLGEGINKIKEVENEFLSNKAIPLRQLEQTHNCTGDSPEERLLSGILNPDIYLYNGRPYTGYAIEGDKENAIYTKYDKGIHVMTFMKNEKTGFAGYTDEKEACANYCVLTATRRTLLTSEYDDEEGVSKVKLITADSKGIRAKKCNAVDSVDNIETQKFVAEVLKYFGSEYLITPYYIFS